MKTVYVVFGTTGEYSDRNEWAVAAYLDKSKAEQHVLAAEQWFRTRITVNADRYGRVSLGFEERMRLEGTNPYDPEMQIDYTGTDYYLVEVELRDDIPQPIN